MPLHALGLPTVFWWGKGWGCLEANLLLLEREYPKSFDFLRGVRCILILLKPPLIAKMGSCGWQQMDL